MPSKKTTRVRAPKSVRGKRKISATPRWMTTSVALGVIVAGGLMLGAHERTGRATPAAEPSIASEPAAAPAAPTAPPADMQAAAQESAAPQTAVATIAGCLERSGDTFRLKDTSGASAPKARSWKSGFMRKSAASIQVLDRARSLDLGRRVGQRVSVTGTLNDRALQARSVRRISSTCS